MMGIVPDDHRRAACSAAVTCSPPSLPAYQARARAWYADKLGLTTRPARARGAALPQRRGPPVPAVLLPGAGTAQHQLAAWVVEDLEAEVAELRGRGVEFEEYDQPGLRTVDGIAVTPVGKAAWFKDSEGNLVVCT